MDELEDLAEGLSDLEEDAPAAPPSPTGGIPPARLQFEIERAMAREDIRELIAARVKQYLPALLDEILSRPSFRKIVRGEITRILASHELPPGQRHR